MRSRGAKVTDMIILVISAIEGIQNQTREVMELIKQYNIPVIIALNKTDRDDADPESVVFDLINWGFEIDELDGPVPSARIAAVSGLGFDELEDKIVTMAENMKLYEDFECPAQCFVVETEISDKTGMLTACIVVKKGVLRVEDDFVCGTSQGKIRYMINDHGERITEAHPGTSVTVGGFKDTPDVGLLMNVVRS